MLRSLPAAALLFASSAAFRLPARAVLRKPLRLMSSSAKRQRVDGGGAAAAASAAAVPAAATDFTGRTVSKDELSQMSRDLRTQRALLQSMQSKAHAPSTASGAVAAAQATLARLVADASAAKVHAKAISTLKGRITLALKDPSAAAADADADADADPAAAADVAALKAEYLALSGEAYSKNPKRGAGGAKNKAKAAAAAALVAPPGPETFPAWAFEPREHFRFELIHQSSKPGSRARVGKIHTPHGVINTPCFVPVGTNGALKAVSAETAVDAETQLMFANTYHLLVHPGTDVIAGAGGLHKFMRRDAPIITDSGGFQVFSLASTSEEDGPELKKKSKRNENGGGSLTSITEHGTVFRSYLDGSTIELTPESSVAAQKIIGGDIIIPLDELPPYHVTDERLRESVMLSHRWEARSLQAHLSDVRKQAMYCVVHGGTSVDLRTLSVEYLSSLPFDGMAIGGSLGKDRDEMHDMLKWLMPLLPADKPNHLLGIADELSCRMAVPLGVDTMDSCNPTRIARHGTLMTSDGDIRIKAGVHRADHGPIDPKVPTIAYSRAYLHHLFKQNEPLALSLASEHNLRYMNKLMEGLREQIMRDEV